MKKQTKYTENSRPHQQLFKIVIFFLFFLFNFPIFKYYNVFNLKSPPQTQLDTENIFSNKWQHNSVVVVKIGPGVGTSGYVGERG